MMTNEDILRATEGLRQILDTKYPAVKPKEMDAFDQQSRDVPLRTHVAHLKYELERIPLLLAEGTRSKREKAFRWLSDVGGVMRSSELRLVSLADLRDLFRPELEDAE